MGQTINYTVSVGEATTGIWIFLRLLPQKRGDTISWLAGYVVIRHNLMQFLRPMMLKLERCFTGKIYPVIAQAMTGFFIPQKSRDSESFKRTCPLCSEKGGENHGTWSQLSDHYIKERTEEL